MGIVLALASVPIHAASALADVLRANAQSDRLDFAAVTALYGEAVVGDGGIDRLLRRLEVFAGGRSRSERQRANTLLTIAHVHWRHGDHAAALAALEAALAVRETVDGLLLKARILDATGDVDAAVPWYERALAASGSAREAEFIHVRLTMAETSARNVDALVELAEQRDQDFQNRAAIVLAILGHPDKATALYRVSDGFGQPFRQHVRLAHWALSAGEHELARRESWLGYDVAPARADALYALVLLFESHRQEDDLQALVAELDERVSPGAGQDPDLVQLRIDLLIETQQYDAAIAFYETARITEVDVDARRRLIDLYYVAGRPDEMVAEYRKLMVAEPTVVEWFAGLASHYLNIARPEDALGVWRTLEQANAGHPAVLLAAGEHMTGMGFLEDAVAMVERQMARDGEHAEGLLFLFDARFGRGRDGEALAILERLEALVAPGESTTRDLADAFERLNRPDLALKVLESLEASEGGLGYNERMRIAWLYSIADRKEDALEAWRAMWVSVDNPARRSLAEDQLLLLAAELNSLGEVVVELEEKLYAGEADRNEIDLLVRIYTEVGDTLSATEVIDEYAKAGIVEPVERLRQLAGVFRLLNDYEAHDGVLRQLARLDPENEVEHVQNLVLNMLAHDLAEDSDERFAEIQRWLDRLRSLDAVRVSGEFEAGIYSLGGFNDEGIESYRRALVRQPENSDNLLLMADLMKTADRRDEAVSLLQYAAEHAVDDNAFVVAVDGIINMIGARSFFQTLTPELEDVFRWTQRIILERITGRNDKFYLYQLLADIAQETADSEGRFLALENSLSEAGIRRPAILRELVTLATPNAGFGGFNTGGGDRRRQLTHGRRLIGLKQALPPEVYINLGKVLLDEGDVTGAEKAFGMIDDITGLVDVDKTSADLLLDAGHPERALTYYSRALSVKRNDLGLLERTARLREANGQDDVANALYLRALGNLLRAEALVLRNQRPGTDRSPRAMFGSGQDTGVSRDYRTYFEPLAQGFLITWPEAPGVAAERSAVVQAMVDEALQTVIGNDVAAGEPLARLPRLQRTAQFARRVAERADDSALAAHVESMLERHLDDVDEEPAAQGSLLQRHLDLAKHEGDFEGAVRLARLAGDEQALAGLLREHLAQGKYLEGLAYAWHLLERSRFKQLALPVLPILQSDGPALVALIARAPDLVLAIEDGIGRPLVPMPDLLAILVDRASGSDPGRNPITVGDGVWRYLKTRATVDEQLRYFAGGAGGYLSTSMFRDLLSVALTPAQREDMTQAVANHLSKRDMTNEWARMEAVALLLQDELHDANVGVLYAVADHVQRSLSIDVDIGDALKTIYEGTPDSGLMALLRLHKDVLQGAGLRVAVGSLPTARFEEPMERILEGVRSGQQVDHEIAGMVYDMSTTRLWRAARSAQRRRAELARAFAAAYPDEPRYPVYRILALHDLGLRREADEALFDYYRHRGEDEFARGALYVRLLDEGDFAAALAVVADGGPDLRDRVTFDALVGKSHRTRDDSVSLFRRAHAGLARQRRFGFFPPAIERDIDLLRQAVGTGDPAPAMDASAASVDSETPVAVTNEEARRALRAVWRGIRAPADDASRPGVRFGGGFLNSLLALPLNPESSAAISLFGGRGQISGLAQLAESGPPDGKPRLLIDAVAGLPESVVEFERYVPSLPPDSRRQQSRLYELLADAIDAAGMRPRRLEELGARLRDGTIGDHEFSLWMILRNREAGSLAADQLEDFAARAGEVVRPTDPELLAMARVYAKAGAFDEAEDHYALLAARLIRHGEFKQRRGMMVVGQIAMLGTGIVTFGSGEPGLLDLAKLVEEIVDRLPRPAARDLIKRICAIASRAEDDEAYAAMFDAFVLRSAARATSPEHVLAEAASISATATAVGRLDGTWDLVKAVELIRVSAIAGAPTRALETLKLFAMPPGVASDAGMAYGGRQYNRYQSVGKLARIYGLMPVSSYPGDSPLSMFVARRERLFPTDPEKAWPGATEWMRTAAEAMLGWLDDDGIDPSRVREMVLTVALQMLSANEPDSARDIVASLFERTVDDPVVTPAERRDLVLVALGIGADLPVDLAAATIADGTLTTKQEVQLIQGMAATGDLGSALRMGRIADRGDNLAVMRELHPLATSAKDLAYAADLTTRIEAAEAARRELGLESFNPLEPESERER